MDNAWSFSDLAVHRDLIDLIKEAIRFPKVA